LYLGETGKDYTGGIFNFVEETRKSEPNDSEFHFTYDEELSPIIDTIEPKMGRLITFTSGWENPHFLNRVTSGERHLLSFWFTCNPRAEHKYEYAGKFTNKKDWRGVDKKRIERKARRRAMREADMASSFASDL
jgi:hypothetical protein